MVVYLRHLRAFRHSNIGTVVWVGGRAVCLSNQRKTVHSTEHLCFKVIPNHCMFYIFRFMELGYSSMSLIQWRVSVRNRRSSWVCSPLWTRRSYPTSQSTPTSASACCPVGLSLNPSESSSCSCTSSLPMESTHCLLRSTNCSYLQLHFHYRSVRWDHMLSTYPKLNHTILNKIFSVLLFVRYNVYFSKWVYGRPWHICTAC